MEEVHIDSSTDSFVDPCTGIAPVVVEVPFKSKAKSLSGTARTRPIPTKMDKMVWESYSKDTLYHVFCHVRKACVQSLETVGIQCSRASNESATTTKQVRQVIPTCLMTSLQHFSTLQTSFENWTGVAECSHRSVRLYRGQLSWVLLPLSKVQVIPLYGLLCFKETLYQINLHIRSNKCGVICRVNRNWTYLNVTSQS